MILGGFRHLEAAADIADLHGVADGADQVGELLVPGINRDRLGSICINWDQLDTIGINWQPLGSAEINRDQ